MCSSDLQGAVSVGSGMVRGGMTAITGMRSSRRNYNSVISRRGNTLEKLDPGGGVKHGRRPNFATNTVQKPPPTTEQHSSIPPTATKPNVYISQGGGQQVSKNHDTSGNVKVDGNPSGNVKVDVSPSGTVPDQKTNISYQPEQSKRQIIYKNETKPKVGSVPSSDAPNRLNEHLSHQKDKQISRRDSKD